MAELARLVEIVVLEQEHSRVRVVRLTPVDADQVELPQPASVALRPDVALDGNPVAYAPPETFSETRRRHRAGPRIAERRELLGGDDEFGKHGEVPFGIDGELWKEVARLLVYASEPVRVRHGGDARHGRDLLLMIDGQWIDDGVLGRDDQTVDARFAEASR